jgi:hypothetical protein
MEEELQELRHEAVPGYRMIFFIAIIIGILYLGIIFMNTL